VSDTTPIAQAAPDESDAVRREDEWWRDAVVYQIYPRSFADGDGDGMGDFAGISSHVPYLARLGVDAVWISPFYVSPQRDAGYDVADYTDVDPRFGTLADVDVFLAEAHAAGIRVIVDLVPNHSSSEHPWFRAALAARPGSRERARYMFRRGSGPDGSLPPNNWRSLFGGPAWEPVGDGDWYLHLFDRSQPDFDWSDPEVADMFDDVLRFWLDRGVDGFRVDVAHSLVKAEGLPDNAVMRDIQGAGADRGPMWDQDGVHEIYRRWRRLLDAYTPARILVAEAWVTPTRMARYVRADEMQQAFNFPYMLSGWSAAALRETIDESLAANHAVDATTTWVQSNHDVVRHATRFGQADPTAWVNGIGPDDPQPDQALGLRRARAITLLTLALPGSAYLYQGEELGLPEHTTLPADLRQDPTFLRTDGAEIGRDGCRVPLPWRADAPAYGFNDTGASWLPQPETFRALAADAQEDDPASTLALYRAAIRLRHERGLGRAALSWNAGPETVLDADLGDVRMVVNTGSSPVALPEDAIVLLESAPGAVAGGRLAGDAAVWLDLRR
jgi:alpha-glucosidase